MSTRKALEEEVSQGREYSTIITHARIRSGFRTFKAGVKASENWHDDDGDPAKRKQLKARITKENLAEGKEGKKANAQIAIALICPKTQSYSDSVDKWKDDMIFAYELWTDDYTQVLGPSLDQFNIEIGQQIWMRIGQKLSPRGGTRTAENGKEYKNTAHYIVEVFATEADALAAVAADKAKAADSGDDVQSSIIYPPVSVYSHSVWDTLIPKIRAILTDKAATIEQLMDADKELPFNGKSYGWAASKQFGLGVDRECITCLIDEAIPA